MVAESFILNAYATIVSWTYVLITILIIYKIITFFTGGSILGKLGGSKDWRKDDDSKRIIDDIPPEDKKKRKENEKKGAPEGIDLENPGFVQVIVLDEDDNPIQGAKVKIIPARMRKRKWLRKRKEWREYTGLTGPDGVWPSMGQYEPIGSGSVTLTVTKRNLFIISWFRNGRYYQKTDLEIMPGEKREIIVHMKRKGEKPEWFEPKILEIKPGDENTMILKGIIK